MYSCKKCDYKGQGSKVCPICYQRLLQKFNSLKKELNKDIPSVSVAIDVIDNCRLILRKK